MADSDFLKIAKQAAKEAGEAILKFSTKGYETEYKGRKNDYVTEADFAAEKIIIDLIKKSFPDHNIIAEESGEENKGSEYTWVIDPLDGTVSFMTGVPLYAVSIGLLKNNKPYLGVVNVVAISHLFSAEKGKGAFLNGQKIHVSKETELKNSVISFDLGHTERNWKINKFILPLADNIRYPYILGPTATTHAFVSIGFLDGFTGRANLWDHLAGVAITEEAGGKVTDLKGNEIDWTDTKIEMVASNGLIHDELIKALNKG